MQSEDFLINKGNKSIAGQIYSASKEDGQPALIISHGFGSTMSELVNEAEFFTNHGYVSVIFDYCGGGNPKLSKSSGKSVDMNIFTEREDLLDVIEYVKTLKYVDESRISLFGYSQGGFVSGLTAAYLEDAIEKLVMVFPAICIPDHARLGMLGGAVYDLKNVPDSWLCPNGMYLGRQFHEKVLNFDPYAEMRRYTGDVLIIHGDKDSVVDYSYSVKAHRNYKPGQSRLRIVRGADHGFDKEVAYNVLTGALAFLKGYEEVLDIKVFITDFKELVKGPGKQEAEVYFTGYCDNENFHGTILPGAKDTQTQIGDGEVRLNAEYVLSGKDKDDRNCEISIINRKDGEFFRPIIKTDSQALDYLNHAQTLSALEFFEGGLTVRIMVKEGK